MTREWNETPGDAAFAREVLFALRGGTPRRTDDILADVHAASPRATAEFWPTLDLLCTAKYVERIANHEDNGIHRQWFTYRITGKGREELPMKTTIQKTSDQRKHQRAAKRASAPRDKRLPEVGSRILRTFHGDVIDVKVEADHFVCGGKNYSSLSKLATEICGSNRNGFLWFGLTNGTAEIMPPGAKAAARPKKAAARPKKAAATKKAAKTTKVKKAAAPRKRRAAKKGASR